MSLESNRDKQTNFEKKNNFPFLKILLYFWVLVLVVEGCYLFFLKRKVSRNVEVADVENYREVEEEISFSCPVPQEYCDEPEVIAETFLGFAIPKGTRVMAVLSGRVSLMSDNSNNAVIEITSFKNGTPAEKVFYYFNPKSSLLVSEGQEVKEREVIANVSAEDVSLYGNYALVIQATDKNGDFYHDPESLFLDVSFK